MRTPARSDVEGARPTGIAKDFGLSESCLGNWLRVADVQDGARPGVTAPESAELRERAVRLDFESDPRPVIRPGSGGKTPNCAGQ